MYKEFNGRVWSSEASYLKFKQNSNKLLNYSLAIESYADCYGKNDVYKDMAFVKLKDFRNKKQTMTESELLEESENLSLLFDNLILTIGKEYFTIYDDGDINFNWPKREKEDL